MQILQVAEYRIGAGLHSFPEEMQLHVLDVSEDQALGQGEVIEGAVALKDRDLLYV